MEPANAKRGQGHLERYWPMDPILVCLLRLILEVFISVINKRLRSRTLPTLHLSVRYGIPTANYMRQVVKALSLVVKRCNATPASCDRRKLCQLPTGWYYGKRRV